MCDGSHICNNEQDERKVQQAFRAAESGSRMRSKKCVLLPFADDYKVKELGVAPVFHPRLGEIEDAGTG